MRPGKRANAQLKGWRILRDSAAARGRRGNSPKAIHIRHARETGG